MVTKWLSVSCPKNRFFNGVLTSADHLIACTKSAAVHASAPETSMVSNIRLLKQC